MERIKELYAWGDLDRDAYQRERDELTGELATLKGASDQATVLAETAAFLADLPAAWQAATPEERNKLARELFGEVAVDNRTAVAVAPRPDLVPFFEAVACQPSDDLTYGRKRRGRFSTFKTSCVQADPSVFRSPTSGLLRRTPHDGRHARGLTTPLPAATPVALAS